MEKGLFGGGDMHIGNLRFPAVAKYISELGSSAEMCALLSGTGLGCGCKPVSSPCQVTHSQTHRTSWRSYGTVDTMQCNMGTCNDFKGWKRPSGDQITPRSSNPRSLFSGTLLAPSLPRSFHSRLPSQHPAPSPHPPLNNSPTSKPTHSQP